ncbi:MAG TPA: MEDS domain-containing protein [Bacteroidota bacterium]|nr:MEDS domain-containing protein [Bacteroidota bacterium]
MDTTKKTLSMGFTKEHFPVGTHMCLIYDNDEERKQIVSKYLAAGIEDDEQVRLFTDAVGEEEVRSWLQPMGVTLPAGPEGDGFRIFDPVHAYCPSGRFDPEAMVGGLMHRYEEAKRAGYTGVRSCGEMSWVLKGIPGSERFLEYEALLNKPRGNFPHIGMCQYDARLFDGATLFKVLQLHPFMIAHGQIISNPFYQRPEEFQAELPSRQ